jgi:hypothetical protein
MLGILAFALLFAAFSWIRHRGCGGECGHCGQECDRRSAPAPR